MFGGLRLLGQAAARAKNAELQAAQHQREHRDHLLHGHNRMGELSEADRMLLADLQKQLHASNLRTSTRCCPECRRPFALVNMREIAIDYCTHCRGCWFEPGELGLVAGTAQDVPATQTMHRKSKYTCPVCSTAMWESVYKKPFTLLVDRCPNGHGVYLEQGELERVLKLT